MPEEEAMVEVPEKTQKEPGMFHAFAKVILAIAKNVETAGPIEMSNMFRVLFRSFLATIMVLGGGWFLWVAAFTEATKLNEHTGVIVGFVTGTFITLAVGFYFGGQDRQKKSKEEMINE